MYSKNKYREILYKFQEKQYCLIQEMSNTGNRPRERPSINGFLITLNKLTDLERRVLFYIYNKFYTENISEVKLGRIRKDFKIYNI